MLKVAEPADVGDAGVDGGAIAAAAAQAAASAVAVLYILFRKQQQVRSQFE